MSIQSISVLICGVFLAVAQATAQDKILVGQSAPLSGGNAKFGSDIRDGAKAYFASVNARGGVNGASIELITLDDKNDRKMAAVNTEKLLNENQVAALFGYASATLSLDAMPQAEQKGVAFFAPFSGADAVRGNSRTLFTFRASYADELEKMLGFWSSLGMTKISVVYYDDEVGKQNLAVVSEYLKKANTQPLPFAIKRNANIQPEDANRLWAMQPQVVLLTVLSGPAAQLQKLLAGMSRTLPTSSLSFIGAEQFVAAAGPSSSGVTIGQVVPSPMATSVPVVRECAKAIQDAGITGPMNGTQLESCMAAKVLVEAMRRVKRGFSAKALRDSLANLGTYDLGGFRVSYSPNSHHGSKFVELAMVSRDGRLMR